MKKIYIIFYLVFAFVFCFGVFSGNDILRAVTKPVPLIILMLSLKIKQKDFFSADKDSKYKAFIFIGFALSLLGDIFLIKIIDKFIFGLAAFLFAHISYIIAFRIRLKEFSFLSMTFFYAAATLLAYLFFPYLEDMFVPVIIYIYVIMTMVWHAFMQRKYNKTAVYAFVGAVIFAFSDLNIAFTKFVEDYDYSKIITIILYWTAQFLIAKSVFRK